jgi:hypothetical protein
MPREDALLLPIDNVSVEALAAHLADRVLVAAAQARTWPDGVVTPSRCRGPARAPARARRASCTCDAPLTAAPLQCRRW